MTHRWRILILDHQEDVLLPLEHVLETAGFDTTVAWHADAFYRLLREQEFDLVIVGHRPPEIDAAEILKSIANLPAQRIILNVFTRHPFENEYFHQLGAHAVLSKWNSDLAACVRNVLPGNQAVEYAS